tara:strand:- start:178 stop:603 length:426 start_codon:yes stop_codon:yes gene_type:complete
MKKIIWLLPVVLLGKIPAVEKEKQPNFPRPKAAASHKAIPHPRIIQPIPRIARWEYCILEVRGNEAQSGPFQLHMPNRSSGRSRDLGKVFREVHIQLVKTSRIDEINALNTLGTLGWELVFSQKKEGPTGHHIFYYLKRRI